MKPRLSLVEDGRVRRMPQTLAWIASREEVADRVAKWRADRAGREIEVPFRPLWWPIVLAAVTGGYLAVGWAAGGWSDWRYWLGLPITVSACVLVAAFLQALESEP